MKKERVVDIFQRLSGLESDQVLEYQFIYDSAMQSIQRKLNNACDKDKESSRLEFAAAALAYYQYVLWSVSRSADEIAVGQISVKNSSGQLKAAEKICREALDNIADIYMGEGFVFERV
ncbi:MAG: hypothetical protein II711_02935 [Clostridia bacterium]|nr:hypothetical protein [Clostridia bacterium]